jgi:DNA-binding transcriptional ArsR family regulator
VAINLEIPDINDGESLSAFAVRRKKVLEAQISALRGQLAPKEAELTQINKLLGSGAIDPTSPDNSSALASDGARIVKVPSVLTINDQTYPSTIKGFLLGALRDHFHNGATPVELREYIKMVYSKEVDRNSISPQLARLRDNGMIEQSPEGFWRLAKSADQKPVKEMIVQALLNRFHNGATVAILADYIHEEYGRVVDNTNLLRQLYSLKESEILINDPNKDSWKMAPQKRELYMISNGRKAYEAFRLLQDDLNVDAAKKLPRG